MTTERGGTGDLQPNVGDAVDSEMGPPQSITGSASPGLGGSGDKLRDTAGRVASRVSDTIGDEVDTRAGAGFDRAGTMLDHMADAVERAGEDLRSEEAPVADVARAAAGQLRSAADYMRSADMGTILGNAEDFARRQPAIFLGGALALGLMASRFLKASPPSSGGYRYGSDTPGRFSAGMSSGYRAYGGYRTPTGAGASRASTGTVAGSSSTLSGSAGREAPDDGT